MSSLQKEYEEAKLEAENHHKQIVHIKNLLSEIPRRIEDVKAEALKSCLENKLVDWLEQSAILAALNMEEVTLKRAEEILIMELPHLIERVQLAANVLTDVNLEKQRPELHDRSNSE